MNINDSINIKDFIEQNIKSEVLKFDITIDEYAAIYSEIGLLFNLSDKNQNTTYSQLAEISRLILFFDRIRQKSKRPLSFEEIKEFMLPYKFEGLYFIDISIFINKDGNQPSIPFDLYLLNMQLMPYSTAYLKIGNKTYHSEDVVQFYKESSDLALKIYPGGDKDNASKTYLIKDTSAGLYKIGQSNNPIQRQKNIAIGNPTCKLLMYCNKNIENELHKRYEHKRVSGEWFNLTDIDVVNILNEFKEIGGEFFNILI